MAAINHWVASSLFCFCIQNFVWIGFSDVSWNWTPYIMLEVYWNFGGNCSNSLQSSTLKMEAADSAEICVIFYQTTLHHIQETSRLHSLCRENQNLVSEAFPSLSHVFTFRISWQHSCQGHAHQARGSYILRLSLASNLLLSVHRWAMPPCPKRVQLKTDQTFIFSWDREFVGIFLPCTCLF